MFTVCISLQEIYGHFFIMPEMVQSFHQSPPSHRQMHSHIQLSVLDVESECNWSFESDFTSSGCFDASDRFQCPEFSRCPFTNFTSSSVDELSKVTTTIQENQSLRKRKLEFSLSFGKNDSRKPGVECDPGLVGPVKARRSIPNGHLKPKMDPKPDYIHVRARHGQATDNHSLAERARREKLKKKLKYLQDLVPGCNKLTNRAAVLDEIITYVQCLQSDVELLTMKLAASTTTVDFNIDNSLSKM